MPTKAKPRRKTTIKAKRSKRKPSGGFSSWDEVDAFIDRAPDNPDPRIRAWATVLWLARVQGTYTVVWNDYVATVDFDLLWEGDALRELEQAGLCSIEWGEAGDADTGRMPDAPIITILSAGKRKVAKR